MIRPLVAPVDPKYQAAPTRTPGRSEGLYAFATKLRALFPALDTYNVLDVGGADGWLAEFLPYREYWCLDPHLDNGPFGTDRPAYAVQGYAEQLIFPDLYFDLVVSKQTLPHLTDPAAACAEMCRVAQGAVVIRQEFPESPIGWPGHSKVQIDSPHDILTCLRRPGWTARYDGLDFVARREHP